MPVAKNIKYCRKKANLTQQQFADAIGVSKATVISWEAKKTAVPVPSAKRVSSYFGINFMEFCDVDLEQLDNSLAGQPLYLTETEKQNILMFRQLPEDVKSLIRYTIISTYERNKGKEEGK